TDRKEAIAEPTEAPDVSPMPPILPLKREWRQAVLDGTEAPRASSCVTGRGCVALGAIRHRSNIEWKNYVSLKGGQVRLVVISTPSAKLRVTSRRNLSQSPRIAWMTGLSHPLCVLNLLVTARPIVSPRIQTPDTR